MAVDAERRLKAGLGRLDGPGPSPELTRRLLAIGNPAEAAPTSMPTSMPTSVAPHRSAVPRVQGRPGSSTPPGRRPTGGPPGAPLAARAPGRRSRLARRGSAVAGGVLSTVGLALGGAFLLGGGAETGTGPVVVPPVGTFSQEHAATVTRLPLGDPAFGAVQVSGTGSYGSSFSPMLVSGVPFR
jgi:hypothetical protein